VGLYLLFLGSTDSGIEIAETGTNSEELSNIITVSITNNFLSPTFFLLDIFDDLRMRAYKIKMRIVETKLDMNHIKMNMFTPAYGCGGSFLSIGHLRAAHLPHCEQTYY
jgi:hypothetical protein